MREWITLTMKERQDEKDRVPGVFNREDVMMECLSATLELLEDSPAAQAIARKVTLGNYLINTPEEIAEHCRAAARGREAI